MKKSLILSILAVMLLGITSCKKDDNTVASKSLVGTFETHSSTNGNYITIYITDATHFSYNLGGITPGYTASGTYSTSGTEVTFTETTSNGCVNVAGKYSYNVTATELTLSLISDPCTNTNSGGASRSAYFIGVWDKI